MNAKEYFKLTVKCLDRQKGFFVSRDEKLKKEAMALENVELNEMIRVALLDKEIYDYIVAECPWLVKKLKQAEAFQQPSLFTAGSQQ